MLDAQRKKEIIQAYGLTNSDNGSTEVQCALLTERINALTGHLKSNPKDHSSRRGLLVLVGRRRKLLEYLKSKSENRYQDLIAKLNIRK